LKKKRQGVYNNSAKLNLIITDTSQFYLVVLTWSDLEAKIKRCCIQSTTCVFTQRHDAMLLQGTPRRTMGQMSRWF